MAINGLKVLGVALTIVGGVVSIAESFVDKKDQERAAVKAAEEAVAKLMKK